MKKLLLVIVSIAIIGSAVWVSKRLDTFRENKFVFSPINPQSFRLPNPLKPIIEPPIFTKEQVIEAITAETCRETVAYLCSSELEGRMTGHKGNVQAALWLRGKLQSFGLETKYQQFSWTSGVNPGPKHEQGDVFSNNIIGVLDGISGRDIIICAHFDHLGYGPRGSRSGDSAKIHPGADDNATGTTLVLEMAQAMYRMKYKPQHRIIFICFSGEEMGLIGSKYYVNNPMYPLNRLDYVFNTDMIGRMNGKTTLSVGGSTKLNPFMEKTNGRHTIKMTATGGGGGGSDHAPFHEKGVPCCCFHSGMHDDYHTPNDTADRIDYDGMHKVIRYVLDLVLEFDKKE